MVGCLDDAFIVRFNWLKYPSIFNGDETHDSLIFCKQNGIGSSQTVIASCRSRRI